MAPQTVQGIRDYIRSYLDLDVTDLSDTLIDAWSNEGSLLIETAESQWPFYEDTWSFTTTASQQDYTISSDIGADVKRIVAISGPQWELNYLGRNEADRRWLRNNTSTDSVRYWSEFGHDSIRLHPIPAAAENLIVRGYRTPNDWISEGAGGSPDFPEELHPCLVAFVLSRAYLQQEDEALANQNMRIFEETLESFKRRINDLPSAQPFILNGKHSYGSYEQSNLGPLLFGFDGR
jgi:hypothetical protein